MGMNAVQQLDEFAGMTGVEIKVTIRPEQALRAVREFELDKASAQIRAIYFYDSLELDLFNRGVALRSRTGSGTNNDTTVKIRPVRAGDVPKEYLGLRDFKLEADCVGEKSTCGASLTSNQRSVEIQEVAKELRPIRKLFSIDQERFFRHFFPKGEFGSLRILGPIKTFRWKFSRPDFATEICAEEWTICGGEILVELSTKVKPEQARVKQKLFHAFLESLGLDPNGPQEMKTKRTLQFFAERLK